MTLPFVGHARTRARQSDLDTLNAITRAAPKAIDGEAKAPSVAASPRFWAPPEQLVAAARTYLGNRRGRNVLFPGGWFSDPAWDLLLDLYISELEGRQVAVSSACIATGVPTTTALRCINRLVRAGFLIRTVDPEDARRSIVTLEPACATKIGYWIAHALMLPAAPTLAAPAKAAARGSERVKPAAKQRFEAET